MAMSVKRLVQRSFRRRGRRAVHRCAGKPFGPRPKPGGPRPHDSCQTAQECSANPPAHIREIMLEPWQRHGVGWARSSSTIEIRSDSDSTGRESGRPPMRDGSMLLDVAGLQTNRVAVPPSGAGTAGGFNDFTRLGIAHSVSSAGRSEARAGYPEGPGIFLVSSLCLLIATPQRSGGSPAPASLRSANFRTVHPLAGHFIRNS